MTEPTGKSEEVPEQEPPAQVDPSGRWTRVSSAGHVPCPEIAEQLSTFHRDVVTCRSLDIHSIVLKMYKHADLYHCHIV